MQTNPRLAMRTVGALVFFFVAAGVAVPGSNLDALVARLKRADTGGRRQIMKSLSKAELRQLHAEYRALSPESKRAVDAALGRKSKAGGEPRVPRGTKPWVVQYDTGTPHSLRDNWGSVVGNHFNIGFENPHTISAVTFSMNGTFANTPVRLYGAPVGTVAPVLAGTTFAGLPMNTLVVWDINPNITGHNGPFLGGVEQSGSFSTINSTFVGVQVDINSNGVGFHGMNINLNGSGFIPNATVGPGVPYNAILRVSGINVPVELMHFDVQ